MGMPPWISVAPVHVVIGTLRIDENHQPRLDRVTAEKTITIDRLQTKTVKIATPGPRFAVRVLVDNKFVPRDLNPRSGDPRTLGAHVDYRFFTKLPPGAKPSRGG